MLGQRNEVALCLRQNYPAAANQNRLFRLTEQARGAFNRFGIRRDSLRRITAKANITPYFGAIDRTVLHVEGQRDVRCARTTGGDLPECRAEGARQIFGAVEYGVPFRHRPHERTLVQFSERVATAGGNRNIRIDAQKRHR